MRKRENFGWVEVRLSHWGAWMARPVSGLSFPGRTQEGRLKDEGPVGSTTNYRDHSPDVEFAHKEHETDRAVKRLPPHWRFIVTRIYVDGKSRKDVCGQLGYSEARLRQLFDQILAALGMALEYEIEARACVVDC